MRRKSCFAENLSRIWNVGGLLLHLAEVARDARQSSGCSQAEIAVLAGLRSVSTVHRFEQAQNWPRNPDRVVRAYAEVSGTTPALLWRKAVEAAREAERLEG
jgi:hypothetical protein